jgi:hypothetical protein
LFEQHHPAAGSCPDSPDGECPEWFCAVCGDALIIGFITNADAEEARQPVRAA